MSEISTDAIEQPVTENFSAHTKLKSLHLLLRYSLKSKKKWEKIKKEIMKLYPIKDSGNSNILSRQSLESWAAGGDLGDEKFKIVYHFLTHPETLDRPEFSDAMNFLHPERATLRIGRTIRDLYGFEPPDIDAVLPTVHEQLIEDGRDPLDAFCSLSFGRFDDHGSPMEYCLSINRMGGEQFFVAHLLSWPINSRPSEKNVDRNYKRLSGLGTLNGSIIKLHFKDLEAGQTHFAIAADRWGEPGYDIVFEKLLIEAIYLAKKDPEQPLGLKYLDSRMYHVGLIEEEDLFVNKIIDNFRWDVLI